MDVNGISSSMLNYLYQAPPEKSGGQQTQQVQQVQSLQQGPAEERSESAAVQDRENSSGGEVQESGLIDTYA